MTRQKQKSIPVISYLFWFALVIIVSCDPFEEDLIEDKDLVTFGQTEYFTIPGSTVIIDVSSIVKQSFVDVTIQISQQPAKGQLGALDDLMLKYVPSVSFVEGSDRFVLSVIRNNKPINTCDIVISMMENVEKFPCALFAVEDFIISKFNSRTSIKFLENDRICGVEEKNLISSIQQNPKHGHAVIAGDSIIYEPDSNYIGNDSIVYKITTSKNDEKDPKVSLGIVTIGVRNYDPDCPFKLEDLYVLDLSDTVLEPLITSDWGPAYEIPVWEGLNINICEIGTVGMGPFLQNSGAFAFGEDGRVLFIPQSNTASNPMAQLRLCVNDQCKDVILKVILKPDSFPAWDPGWSESTVTEIDEGLTTIYFVNELVGYVAGASSMYKTIDGAKTWERLPFEVPSIQLTKGYLSELDFISEDIGYASYGIFGDFWLEHDMVNPGGVLKTTDGGKTWTTLASFQEEYVYSVDFVNANVGYLAQANIARERVYIMRTTNGGKSWQTVLELGAPAEHGVPKVRFLNDGTSGYVHYWSRIYKTVNAGESWNVSYDNTFGLGEAAIPYFALSSSSGIAIANVYEITTSTVDLYRSDDGADWAKIDNDKTGQLELSPLGNLGINYVDAAIFISTDYARTWQQVSLDPSFSSGFLSASVPSERVVYVLSREGKVLKYVKN